VVIVFDSISIVAVNLREQQYPPSQGKVCRAESKELKMQDSIGVLRIMMQRRKKRQKRILAPHRAKKIL